VAVFSCFGLTRIANQGNVDKCAPITSENSETPVHAGSMRNALDEALVSHHAFTANKHAYGPLNPGHPNTHERGTAKRHSCLVPINPKSSPNKRLRDFVEAVNNVATTTLPLRKGVICTASTEPNGLIPRVRMLPTPRMPKLLNHYIASVWYECQQGSIGWPRTKVYPPKVTFLARLGASRRQFMLMPTVTRQMIVTGDGQFPRGAWSTRDLA
jgi:hypothetical protein